MIGVIVPVVVLTVGALVVGTSLALNGITALLKRVHS